MPQYIVKKGDTLSSIAKNNNIKLKDILSINDIENPDYIQVGWKINLPNQKTSPNNVPVKSKVTPKPVSPVYPKTNTPIQQKPLVTNYNNFFEQYKTKPDVSVKNKPVTTPSSKQKTTDYSQFFEQYKTNNPIQSKTVTSPIKSANKPIEKKEETTGFFDNMKNEFQKYAQTTNTFINRKILPIIPGYDIGKNEKISNIDLKQNSSPKIFENIKGNKIYNPEFGKEIYHSSRYIDLDNPEIKTKAHNRGEKITGNQPFKEILFSNFDDNVFENINYLKENKKLKDDSFYMGTDVNNKLIIGYRKDIKNINGSVSAFSVLKDITGFSKNNKGFELQKSNFANNAKDPFLVNESGLKIPINILTSEEKEGHKKYGQYYGGSFILTTPDMKKKTLVSGSLQELDDLVNKFKKDNNLTKLNIIKVDNGSYSRQFGTDNLEGINQEFWNKYEGLNNRGGNAIYTYKHGGKVTADTIYALNKKPKVVLTPDDIYENGGIVQVWIQKFLPGGSVQDLNSFSTQYSNWNINEEFDPYSLYNTNPKIMGNKAQMALPENNSALSSQILNKDGKMPMNKDGKIVGNDVKTDETMSKIENMSNMGQAIDLIGSSVGDFSNIKGDVRNKTWQDAKAAAAKSNPIFGAFHGIDEGLQGIGKMIGGDKGQKGVQFFTDPIGFWMNLGSGIKTREEDKRKKQLEYDERNMMPIVNQPSYYGNYMAKYGANPKMMEQRVIDDIYSDFDKYMKKV